MMNNKSRKPLKSIQSPVEKKRRLISIVFFTYCLTVIPFININSLLDPAILSKFIALVIGTLILILFYSYFIYKVKLSINISVFKRIIFPIFLLLVFSSGLSIITAISPSEAVFDFSKNLTFLTLFSVFALLYSNADDLRNIITKLITLFSSIIIVIGFYQLFRLIGDGATYSAIIRKVAVVFMNKNLFSQMLFLLLPFNIFSLKVFDRKWRALGAINSLLIITLITILLTRSVWVASCISAIIIITIAFVDQKSGIKNRFIPGRRIIIILIVIFSTISLVLVLILGNGKVRISNGLVSKMDISKGTSQARFSMWKHSIGMFKENPILGVGGGNWKIQIPKYGIYNDLKTYGKKQFQRPHNDYLWVLSEYGLLGFIAYLGIAFLGFFYLFKILIRADNGKDKLFYYLLLFGLTGYLIFSFFSYPKERISHNIYFYFILSIAVADYDKLLLKNPNLLSATKLLIPASIFTLILSASLYLGVSRFTSEKHIRLAIDASHQNQFSKTIIEVDKGYSWLYTMDPTGTPLPWYKGLAYFREENTKAALNSFLESKQLNPYHSHTYNSIGIVYATKSDFAHAKKYFIEALELRPYSKETIINLSRIYKQEQNYQTAFELLQRINPRSKNSNYRRIMVDVLENKIDKLTDTVQEVQVLDYIELVRQSKPTTFALYYTSVKEEHSFENQYLDYIVQQVLKNEMQLDETIKNRLESYLIEN